MARTFLWSVVAMGLAAGVVFGGPAAAEQPDRGAEADSFDYFTNNWNVVGLKDYNHGSRITPDNELWLGGRTAVQVRYGQHLTPLSRKHGKRLSSGWLPVICVSAEDGPVAYEFTYWATPLPDAKDWQAAFGWPTEGENFLVWVRLWCETIKQHDGTLPKWCDATSPRRSRLTVSCHQHGRTRTRR